MEQYNCRYVCYVPGYVPSPLLGTLLPLPWVLSLPFPGYTPAVEILKWQWSNTIVDMCAMFQGIFPPLFWVLSLPFPGYTPAMEILK